MFRLPADRLVLLLCVVALTGGCAAAKPVAGGVAGTSGAAAGDAPPSGFPAPTGKCIFLDTINDWKAVDPYHLLVRTRATGWQWEITLDRRCSEILYANALEWNTIDTRVCDSRSDSITVPRNRCTIGSIRPYEAPPVVPDPPAQAGGW